MTREAQLIQAVKDAIPWLVLLGDHIGNGIGYDPEGRCRVLAALHDALGDDDVPNGYPPPADGAALAEGKSAASFGTLYEKVQHALEFQAGVRSKP